MTWKILAFVPGVLLIVSSSLVVETRESRDTSNVVDGNHVDRIVHVRNEAKLDRALDKTPGKSSVLVTAVLESPTRNQVEPIEALRPREAAIMINFSATHLDWP